MTPGFGRAVLFSCLLHAVLLLVFSLNMHGLTKPPQQAMQVKLMPAASVAAATERAPQAVVTPAKPAEAPQPQNVRTQASAAPKEAPKPARKVQESKAPTKLVQQETKKQPPKKPEPKQEEAKPRPPVLDKTREKQVVKNDDPEAKTVARADDFLKTLDFIDTLEPSARPAAAPTPQTEAKSGDSNVAVAGAEASEIAKIQKHIEQHWLRPSGLRTEDLGTVVEVRLTPDGEVSGLKVVTPSGQRFYDDSVLRAVRKAVPIPLPTGKYETYKVLMLHFAG